jgi:hypothetical protein
MKERVRQILTDLERVRENLLALSDDIWLNIDHHDQDALREGVKFKLAYNDKMSQFNTVASDLSALVQTFMDVPVEAPQADAALKRDTRENERLVRELDREEPHTLDEDFSYKRPYGFVLQGQAYKDIVSWRRVYELTCQQLAAHDPARFAALPTDPEWTGKRGNKAFATDPKVLRFALPIADNVYAEGNLSANNVREHIKRLLRDFGIDPKEFVIYLREDRDASAEA